VSEYDGTVRNLFNKRILRFANNCFKAGYAERFEAPWMGLGPDALMHLQNVPIWLKRELARWQAVRLSRKTVVTVPFTLGRLLEHGSLPQLPRAPSMEPKTWFKNVVLCVLSEAPCNRHEGAFASFFMTILIDMHRRRPNPMQRANVLAWLRANVHSYFMVPRSNIGFASATYLGAEKTQSKLNTFHGAGIASVRKNSDISRFKNLLNASKSTKGCMCKVTVRPGAFSGRESVRRWAARLVECTIAGMSTYVDVSSHPSNTGPAAMLWNKASEGVRDIWRLLVKLRSRRAKDSFKNDAKLRFVEVHIHCDREKLVRHTVSFVDVVHCVKRWAAKTLEPYFQLVPNLITLQVYVCGRAKHPPEQLTVQLKKAVIQGLVGVEGVRVDPNDGTLVHVFGSNLMQLLCHDGVARVESNSVWETYNTFGMEMARRVLRLEFQSMFGSIAHQHVEILCDHMTMLSFSNMPISRFSHVLKNISVLAKSSFEYVVVDV